jgi:hypothetical protein
MSVWKGSQKLASRAKVWSALSTPTPDFEYSPTHFLNKFVFPWRLIIFHPFKRVANFILSLVAKGNQKLVGAKLDEVAHNG